MKCVKQKKKKDLNKKTFYCYLTLVCKQQSPVKPASGLFFLSPHPLQMDQTIFQQTLHHLAKNTPSYQKTHGEKNAFEI